LFLCPLNEEILSNSDLFDVLANLDLLVPVEAREVDDKTEDGLLENARKVGRILLDQI